MKVGSVIQRVRSIAGDTAVLQFTDSDIIDWLNDGVRECALQNSLLQKNATSSTAVGVSQYDLPTDIMKLHSVTVDGEKLLSQTLQEWQETSAQQGAGTTSGQSLSYYVWATKITLFPTPDAVKSLVVSYTYLPSDLTYNGANGVGDNTTKNQDLPLPVEYQARLVDYCLAQVAQQDGDSNLYQLKMQEFQTGVSSLKEKPEAREDVYPSISVSSRDSGFDDCWYY